MAGPELELDRRFAGMLADGEVREALGMDAGVRGGASSRERTFAATVHAYGPSSASGNYVISLAAR